MDYIIWVHTSGFGIRAITFAFQANDSCASHENRSSIINLEAEYILAKDDAWVRVPDNAPYE